MGNLKESSIKISGYISVFLLLSYFFGFLAWNSFLSHYGFFEYGLLQTRYISAGVLFLLLPTIIILILYPNRVLFERKSIFLLFVYFLIFVRIIFPWTPQYFGGARPMPISIIGTPEQIQYLRNFNAIPAENAEDKPPVQTKAVCGIYQNNNFIIAGIAEPQEGSEINKVDVKIRVITIRQDQILGFEAIPPPDYASHEKMICGGFMRFF